MTISVTLGVLALLAGTGAAWFWYESAMSMPTPSDAVNSATGGIGQQWFVYAARNNRVAAALSGVSVFCGAVSSFLSTIATLS